MKEQHDPASPPPVKFADWTTSQRELWPLHNLESNVAALNTGDFTEFFGAIDQAAFVEACRRTLGECEALRARFVERDDGPVQIIEPLGGWMPGLIDFSAQADPRARALDWMRTELARAFDPARSMFSWTLIRLGERHFIWCFIVHQLALDGFGRNLVARRLAALYSQLVGAAETDSRPLAPLSDLLAEDAAYRASGEFEASARYWAVPTSDLPPTARLTPQHSGGSYLCARYTAPLPAATAAAMRHFMQQTGVSLGGLFACLSAIHLHRVAGAADVVVGLLVSARATPQLRGAPGNVSNTVPLRLRFKPDTTLDALITQARARLREALKHQRFPLSDMKAALPSLRGEMFAIAVNVMKFDYALAFAGAASVSHNLSNGPVDDLSISVFEQPGEDGLQIALNGNIGRYCLDELKGHYDRLVAGLHALCGCDPAMLIADIPGFPALDPRLAVVEEIKSVLAAPRADAPYLAPRTAREKLLCRLYAESLGVPRVSVNDNYFESGGHSLLAARLASRLSLETKTRIPLRAMFEHPTPGALAAFLETSASEGAAAAKKAGKPGKPLLVLFPGGGVLSREVISLRNVLNDDFSVALVDYPDWRDNWDLFFDFDKYLVMIMTQVRAAAPTPCALHIVGYSFGAGIAYVMTIMLRRLGYTIERLSLIDGRSPVLVDVEAAKPPAPLLNRLMEFTRRDGLSRSRQIGRYIGLRAKNPVVRKLLKWIGPVMPKDHASELVFYLTAFINASIPMQEIRRWTQRLGESERRLDAKSVLFRSMDSGDNWPRDLAWRPLIPAIDVKMLPGTHFTVIADENLGIVRSLIAAAPTPAKPVREWQFAG